MSVTRVLMGGGDMSGWKRLGVTLSVLWVIAGPLWLLIDTNTRANESYERCLRLATSISGDYADAVKGEQVYKRMSDRCEYVYSVTTTTLSKMIEDKDSKAILAVMIGGPIAALWLLGAIVIGTCRWISRGFRRA